MFGRRVKTYLFTTVQLNIIRHRSDVFCYDSVMESSTKCNYLLICVMNTDVKQSN